MERILNLIAIRNITLTWSAALGWVVVKPLSECQDDNNFLGDDHWQMVLYVEDAIS